MLISLSAGMFFVAQMVLSLGQNSQGFQSGAGNRFLVERSSGLVGRLKTSVSRLEPRHLYFLTAVVVITAGVLMTRSRSGIVTLVLVVMFSGLLLSRANPIAVISLTPVSYTHLTLPTIYSV